MKKAEILLIVSLGLGIRSLVSLHGYSGQGQPPLFGDYEAQRHWQEITINLPIEDWYRNSTENDLNYWGLDYPPLSAYHSYLLGFFAKYILKKPEFVELGLSRGYESLEHMFFMRSSVLLSDLLLLFPSIFYVNPTSTPVDSLITFLIYPGLILIDNGHFQYNGVSLSLFLFSVGALLRRKRILGTLFFVLSLSYKQMELYHALPLFFYVLGDLWKDSYTREKKKQKGRLRILLESLTSLVLTVLVSATLLWFPFLKDGRFDVFLRIFPFSRGLFEDKVSNFWCSLNTLIKLKGLLSTFEAGVLSACLTALNTLPSCLFLLAHPSERNLFLSLIISSLSFFLFSFQVHEKSILLVSFPLLLWITYYKNSREFPFLVLLISILSLFPLLRRDSLTLPFAVTFFLYGLWGHHVGIIHLRLRTLLVLSPPLLIIITSLYLQPPSRLPDLWTVLLSTYSSLIFMFSLFYFYKIQIKEKIS